MSSQRRGGRLLAAVVSAVVVGLVGCRAPAPQVEDLASAEWKLKAARVAIKEQRFEDAEALLQQAELQAPGIDRAGLLRRVRSVIASVRVASATPARSSPRTPR